MFKMALRPLVVGVTTLLVCIFISIQHSNTVLFLADSQSAQNSEELHALKYIPAKYLDSYLSKKTIYGNIRHNNEGIQLTAARELSKFIDHELPLGSNDLMDKGHTSAHSNGVQGIQSNPIHQISQQLDEKSKFSKSDNMKSKRTKQERVCLIAKESVYEQTPCRREEIRPRQLPEATTVIELEELPNNTHFYPEIGNGHVATVIYSDTIYMNGLYNGPDIFSARARIPSTAAVLINISTPSSGYKRKYRMDFGRGVFSEIYTASDFNVELRRYAHRRLPGLLVTDLTVNRTLPARSLVIDFNVNNGPPSEDIDFHEEGQGLMSGFTKIAEYPNLAPVIPVSVMYSTVLPNMTFDDFLWAYIPYFTCVSTVRSEAIECFNEAMNMAVNGTLFTSHVEAWESLWNKGRIDLTGNDSIALTTYAGLYYLLSSLPLENSQSWPFIGLSPEGLAHGGKSEEYWGHVFWDQDTWMFPSIMLLHSDLGRIIVGTRLRTHDIAVRYANLTGFKGARFPWESAFTGFDVTRSPECRVFEVHLTSDTSWMMRRYLQLTNDTDFLVKDGGYKAIADMANFWLSRAVLNTETSQYEIRDVMGPDEWHSPVNNSVFTNAAAVQSMMTALYAAILANQSASPEWSNVVSTMYIPFDEEQLYHPEYDNYVRGTTVKQGDVILLGYPLQWLMSDQVRINDLDYYAHVTPSGPAMTWSMFTINHLQVGQSSEADAAFLKSMYNVQEPFKVWSENADGTGSVNFHTGIGGYLQSLLFGYVGFELTNNYIIMNPLLPPSVTKLCVTGFDYVGNSLDVIFDAANMNITLTKEGDPLSISVKEQVQELRIGVTLTFFRQQAKIFPTLVTCGA